MVKIKGKSVCGGIAFGKIFVYSREPSTIKRCHIPSSGDEIARFDHAREQARTELEELYKKAVHEVGEANAMIFRIHQMMLDDMDYLESIKNIITDQLLNAETAVGLTCDTFVQMFESMDDSYMRERSADVKDVSERLVRILEGKSRSAIVSDEPVILIADDLAPSEIVQLDKDKILAFVSSGGSATSHTAILARMMNIPVIIGMKDALDPAYNGKEAVTDGFSGTLYIEPTDTVAAVMQAKLRETERQRRELEKLKGQPSVTKDGKRIEISANIGNVLDIETVLRNDAEGIGLFRSEFLYIENRGYPTEDTQFAAYKEILSRMNGRRVIIRTLDIGADKQINGKYSLTAEPNPALGLRAIRFCLSRPDIFKTQLRALYRASVFGKLGILFPMITSEWEIVKIKELIEDVKTELTKEGIAYSASVELGCMIETPAAAVISDILAKHLDFFSIGTNDLTQYTLAADRQNPEVSQYFDAHHKSILRLMEIAVRNAHKNGAWIGICGELGADLSLTETFLALGIDELSVTPSAVLPIRRKVTETTVSAVQDRIMSEILN